MKYASKRKKEITRRLISDPTISIPRISLDEDVPTSTLYSWRRDALKKQVSIQAETVSEDNSPLNSASTAADFIRETKKSLLFKEIDIVHSSIRKFDDLSNNLKKWTIVAWSGSIAVCFHNPTLTDYIYATGILPLLFLLSDAHLHRLQRSFIYRFSKITAFINSDAFDNALTSNDYSLIKLLDPRGWLSRGNDYHKFISLRTTLNFRSVSWPYLIMAMISIFLSLTRGLVWT